MKNLQERQKSFEKGKREKEVEGWRKSTLFIVKPMQIASIF